MIHYYSISNSKLTSIEKENCTPETIVWIDLIHPDESELKSIEELLSIEMPTREAMHEIEVSSRLYCENGTTYITSNFVTHDDSEESETHAVTFILKDHKIVTLRYCDPRAFSMYHTRIAKNQADPIKNGFDIFLGIMDASIDRLSDLLEMIGKYLDETSKTVFQKSQGTKSTAKDFQSLLKKIGRFGDLNAKLRESILNLARVFSYLILLEDSHKKVHIKALKTCSKDVSSLADHTGHIANRINLLLDATLGMINIEQNTIIKIFSVAAVVFLPPTLIASIYGMNFHAMPELSWHFGYPFALLLMVISAILPYLFFKKKGWL